MVPLSAEMGRGVPVRHRRPEWSPRVMVSANVMSAMNDGEHIGAGGCLTAPRAEPFGDAEGPELHGTNHRTGHGDGP